MKTCTKCNVEKEDIYFRKFRYKCKQCTSFDKKEYRKQYNEQNKDSLKEKKALYLEITKDIRKLKRKIYYDNNRDILINKSSNYIKNNKEKISIRQKNKYKNNIKYKIRSNISSIIRKSLKSNKSSKQNKSILNVLPYTIEELKNHLELLFEDWMTWENHGNYRIKLWNDKDNSTWTWQIDHIIPHSTFKYTDMECQEFKDCWSLSNLRPYSAKLNQLDGVTRIRHTKENVEKNLDISETLT